MVRKEGNEWCDRMRPVTANQIAIKDAQRPKKPRAIKEKEMASTDRRYQLAVMVLLERFQHTLNR